MNILIIGGLLALAVVAIIGAVLLGIGEEHAEKQRAAAKDAQPSQEPVAPPSPVVEHPTVPLAPVEPELPTATPSAKLRATVLVPVLDESVDDTAYHNGHLPPLVTPEEQAITMPISQLYAITSEVRFLGQKAGELEQKLNEVLASLAHTQDEVTTKIPVITGPEGQDRHE